MFGNILGKSKKEEVENASNSEIVEKVSKMNLSDMRIYVNNKNSAFEICEEGLSVVMRRLISKDENSKRFIESDAMDSKIKKAFDLVLIITANKKMTKLTSELIEEFIVLYSDIIKKFDIDNKQIYADKLQKALINALTYIQTMAEVNKKINVLK